MCALDRDVRFTFKGLWEVMADDAGRFRADPRLVKAQVWPLDKDITFRKVEKFLKVLADRRRVVLYEVDAVPYGLIVNWLRHQRIDHPTPSIIPPPPDPSAQVPREQLVRTSRSSRETLAPERSGVEGMGDGRESGAEAPPAESLQLNTSHAPTTVRHGAPSRGFAFLPERAERFIEEFYGDSSPQRREDVRKQLHASITPAGPGAQLRAGVFVRARNAEHLDSVCDAVITNPPRKKTAAMWFVLLKLEGPSAMPAPARAANLRDKDALDLEEAYFAAAREATPTWARAHPEHFERMAKAVDDNFRDAGSGVFYSMARESALICEVIRAGGFPTFDAWVKGRRTHLGVD